jgi:hypothetical protein
MHKNEHRIFVSRKFKFQLAARIRAQNAYFLQFPRFPLALAIALQILLFETGVS